MFRKQKPVSPKSFYLHRERLRELIHLDIDVQIDDPGQPHKPGLKDDHYSCCSGKEVVKTVVLIGESEYGVVPKDVEKEDEYRECVIDTRAIIGFTDQLHFANGTMVVNLQTLVQRKDVLICKYLSLSALGALHLKYCGD